MTALKLTKKYNAYPEYKSETLVEPIKLPVDWSVGKLANLGEFPSTHSAKGELLSVYLDRGVIRASEGSLGTHAPSDDLSKYQVVQKGDLILNNQQAWRGSVGVSELDGIISPAYILFRFGNHLVPRYYNYLIRSELVVDQFRLLSKGVGNIQRQIHRTALKDVRVPVPSQTEQEKIVAFLDKKTALIDVIIEKKQKLIELLKEKRAAVINHAVTKGLDPDAPLVDSGIPWIGKIPKGWGVRKLKHFVIYSIAGEVIDKSHWTEDGSELTYSCAKSPFKSDYAKFEDRRRTTQYDLLLARNGYGVVHVPEESAIYTNVVQLVRLNQSINRVFLYYSLAAQLGYIQGYSMGDFITSINYGIWKEADVSLPNLADQGRIVDFLESESKSLDAVIREIEHSVVTIEEFKSALIAQAVTGKIKI